MSLPYIECWTVQACPLFPSVAAPRPSKWSPASYSAVKTPFLFILSVQKAQMDNTLRPAGCIEQSSATTKSFIPCLAKLYQEFCEHYLLSDDAHYETHKHASNYSAYHNT